jgi:hypothetical protein
VFAYIKDKIWKLIQGWNKKMFHMWGSNLWLKHVLIQFQCLQWLVLISQRAFMIKLIWWSIGFFWAN